MAHSFEPLFYDAGRCHECGEERRHENHGWSLEAQETDRLHKRLELKAPAVLRLLRELDAANDSRWCNWCAHEGTHTTDCVAMKARILLAELGAR